MNLFVAEHFSAERKTIMNSTHQHILDKALCIQELERLNKAQVHQFAQVYFQSGIRIDKKLVINVYNNPGSTTITEMIADSVFRPALMKALEEYKKQLCEFIETKDGK